MTVWYKVAGDEGDSITVTLHGVAGLAGAASVEAHVWRSTVALTLAAAITDEAASEVLVDLDGWLDELSLNAEQAWNLEVQVDWIDGSSITWPDGNPDTIVVRPEAP